MPGFDKGRVKRKFKYYDYYTHGTIGAAGVGTSAHTNNPPEQEIAALGLVGLEMNTAGDMVNMAFPIPYDLNVEHAMGVRVVFQTGSATAADTITWIVLYDVIADGVAVAVGTTALDTAITAASTVTGTAQALELGSAFRGVINGATFTETQVSGRAWISWNIEMDAKAAGLTEDIIFLGLEIDYVPKRYEGPAQTFNSDYTTY